MRKWNNNVYMNQLCRGERPRFQGVATTPLAIELSSSAVRFSPDSSFSLCLTYFKFLRATQFYFDSFALKYPILIRICTHSHIPTRTCTPLYVENITLCLENYFFWLSPERRRGSTIYLLTVQRYRNQRTQTVETWKSIFPIKPKIGE